MPTHILPFPGKACACYRQGRCLKEELRNPGLHLTYRCGVLQKTIIAWDAFLDRAEAFSLSTEEAARIWRQREAQLLSTPCPIKNTTSGSPCDCPHCHEDLCTLLLPPCPGVCPSFLPRG